MAVKRITKEMLEHPELPAKGHAVTWDDSPGLGGFGIRVSPGGRVSFLCRYRAEGRDQWVTIGAFPKMNLTEARKRAGEILKAVAAGGDPVAEKRKAEAEKRASDRQTVGALAAEWLEALPSKTTRRGRRISPRTVEMYESCMRLHILPLLGSRPVLEVTRGDVRELLARATKNGGPYTGNRAVSVLSIFYSHLEGIEAVPARLNPAARPPRNPEQRRGEHASVRLSREQEARLVAAIYAAGKRDPIGAAALLALLDTGRRLREVLGLTWERLDLDARRADLGATKGKAAGDVVSLTARVCDALRDLPRIVGNPHVFTGSGKGGRRSGLQSAWEAVKREADLEKISADLAGFHLHDLRHHRISEMLAAGMPPQLVARQVGHTSLDQLRTYGHLEVADVETWLDRLTPVEPAPLAPVLAFAAR